MKVLVLLGGRSSERDVSLATGEAVSRGLHEAGHQVILFDPAHEQGPLQWTPATRLGSIAALPPEPTALAATGAAVGVAMTPSDVTRGELAQVDLVFIALHGGDGENGRLQALLDTCGVRYTGSGMQASVMAMDKHVSKRLFLTEDIPTPRWWSIDREGEPDFLEIKGDLGLPLIVKPNAQGSTVGLTLVKKKGDWAKALEEAFRWDNRVLAEEYIAGREITVGVLDGQPLPAVEIFPGHELYDYESKYSAGGSQYACPADLTEDQAADAQELGLRAYHALDCRGYARADFRMAKDGQFYCLEVNTLPGMTATSLVPKAAQAAGIDFSELLTRICKAAINDAGK